MEFMDIPVTSIIVGDNHRDIGSIDGLATSMQEVGQLTPILVRVLPEDDQTDQYQYELIAGFRRTRAALELGWLDIMAVVLDHEDKRDDAVMQLVENVARKELTVTEEARALFDLNTVQKVKLGDLSKLTGISTKEITQRKKIAKLPPALDKFVDKGQMTWRDIDDLLERKDLDQLAPYISERMEAGSNAYTARGMAVSDLERAKFESEMKDEIEGWIASGVKVLNWPIKDGTYSAHSMLRTVFGDRHQAKKLVETDAPNYMEGVRVPLGEHIGLPCHVVVITSSYGVTLEHYCSDPKVHYKKDAEVEAVDAKAIQEIKDRSREEKQQDRIRQANEVRSMAEWRKQKINAKALLDLMATAILRRFSYYSEPTAGAILQGSTQGYAKDRRALWHEAIKDESQSRVALAFVALLAENPPRFESEEGYIMTWAARNGIELPWIKEGTEDDE